SASGRMVILRQCQIIAWAKQYAQRTTSTLGGIGSTRVTLAPSAPVDLPGVRLVVARGFVMLTVAHGRLAGLAQQHQTSRCDPGADRRERTGAGSVQPGGRSSSVKRVTVSSTGCRPCSIASTSCGLKKRDQTRRRI